MRDHDDRAQFSPEAEPCRQRQSGISPGLTGTDPGYSGSPTTPLLSSLGGERSLDRAARLRLRADDRLLSNRR
jgi:hypothetical protein